VLRPLWINFIYLIFLGIIFGFLFPWTDDSSYRLWTQGAQGRAIITLVRYLNEFFIALYFFWIIRTNKINLHYVVYAIGWVTFISFSIALIEYAAGPIFRLNFLDSPNIISDRFFGLNNEPKVFGRNSALAYIIILFFYLKIERNRKLLFFIIINAIGVILSLSASAYVMFAVFTIYLLIDQKRLKLLMVVFLFTITSFFVLQNNPIFNDSTKMKIEKVFTGSSSDFSSTELAFISRFDIFDHLALLFLYDNPKYILTGTGPNLISIPASKYVGDFTAYSFYAQIGGIDSVPNVMINNVLANSGLIGLFLFFLFFTKLFRYSKSDRTGFSKNMIVIILISNMIYFNVVLLLFSGIIVGYIDVMKINKVTNMVLQHTDN